MVSPWEKRAIFMRPAYGATRRRLRSSRACAAPPLPCSVATARSTVGRAGLLHRAGTGGNAWTRSGSRSPASSPQPWSSWPGAPARPVRRAVHRMARRRPRLRPLARARSCPATATAPASSTSAAAATCTSSAQAAADRRSSSSRAPGWRPMTGAMSATRPTRPNRRRPTRRRSSPRPRGSPPPAPTTGRAPSRWRAPRAGRRPCRSRRRASRAPPTSMRCSRPRRSRGRTCSSGTRWAG